MEMLLPLMCWKMLSSPEKPNILKSAGGAQTLEKHEQPTGEAFQESGDQENKIIIIILKIFNSTKIHLRSSPKKR